MLYGHCFICRHTIVDRHRIVPGRAGGKYTNENTIEMCNWHHREVHKAYSRKLGKSYYKKDISLEDYMVIILHMRNRYISRKVTPEAD